MARTSDERALEHHGRQPARARPSATFEEASRVCRDAVNHCIEKRALAPATSMLQLLIACAQECESLGLAVDRGLRLDRSAYLECAALCDSCATECEGLGIDARLERASTACRTIAASCRDLAATAAP